MAKEATAKEKTTTKSSPKAKEMLFGKQNYFVLLGGLAIIAVGFILMTGGQQPPDQWDTKVIYSFRRISLSSLLVIGGMVVTMFSIFRKKTS